MSFLGNIAKIAATVLPAAIAGPAGYVAAAAAGTVAAGEAKKEAKKKQARLAQERDICRAPAGALQISNWQ